MRIVNYPQNQIIDVTKDCEFQWQSGGEPKPCYAFLEVSGASGDFTDGETVTGQTSGATATVFSSYVDGSRVYVENVSGTFQTGETITGSSSNQTATVDGFVPERSWTSTPNNIIYGSFPDSFLNDNPDDYLEFESALPGSGIHAEMHIQFTDNKDKIAVLLLDVGIGEKVSRLSSQKYICGAFMLFPPHYATYLISYYHIDPYVYNEKFGARYLPGIGKWYRCRLALQASDKNILRWKIYRIRVLEFVV